MAKSSKAADVEEIEDLEDLEALADATADSPEEEESGEDKPAKKKAAKKETSEKVGIGSKELAEALGTTGRTLRVMLRSKGANTTPEFKETKRYNWPSLKAALTALGFDSIEDAQAAIKESNKERLEALKEKVGESRKKDKDAKDADEDGDGDDD